MEQKDTLYGNELISKFMGFFILNDVNHQYLSDKYVYKTHSGKEITHLQPDKDDDMYDIISIKSLDYHNSWDSLMKVVYKIESLGYDFIITRGGIQIWDWNKRNDATGLIIDEDFQDEYLGKDKLDNVYSCCISFIESYNKKSLNSKIVILYRPVAQKEFDLIKESGWKKFPPILPEQPYFYPVMNEEYATQISKEWNVPAYGIGYVLKFAVRKDFVDKYEVHNVGGDIHNELWIPAEDLEKLNNNIEGDIITIKRIKK